MTNPVRSWSASRLGLYQQCPLKFKLTHLDKLPGGQVKSPAMERGTKIHELAEAYVLGTIARLPPELAQHADLFRRLRVKRKKEPGSVLVEEGWGFTREWGYAGWKDWANCWARIKVDLIERTGDQVVLNDWKTGRYYPDSSDEYLQQLDLYGLATVITLTAGGQKPWPALEVRPRLVYLDAGRVYPAPGAEIVYRESDVPRLKKEWDRRVKPMFNDKRFAPRPNKFCAWCPFNKAAGGPCQY